MERLRDGLANTALKYRRSYGHTNGASRTSRMPSSGRLTMNRPPTEAAYLYLTTAVKVALLFAVLEVGHRLQLVLRCVKHRVIRIIAISIFRL